ncbi:MAG: radical SAM family heme chaperone HemW, partial [Firmicutes bacterium]|nr:radical SAM family heme chaperone HemW [Bacillota bacterium]
MTIEFAPDDWGLYVHIPFCRARCTYCDFNTVTHMGEDQHRQYLDAVAREWQSTQMPTGRLISVFFGGGTPSLVHPSLIAEFLDAVRDRVGSLGDVEITLESNPGTLDPNRLTAFRRAGVNRLSVGAQAMQADHLKALNRIHSVEDIFLAVAFARQAQFSNLNLDAIYGLPSQTVDQWRETLRKLIDLGPEHLSLYRLQVEEGTPLAAGVAQGDLHLPQEDLVADMADLASMMLAAAGYETYEISNWARAGHESRHNQLYWTLNSYIGLGAGAHSFHNNRRWQSRAG